MTSPTALLQDICGGLVPSGHGGNCEPVDSSRARPIAEALMRIPRYQRHRLRAAFGALEGRPRGRGEYWMVEDLYCRKSPPAERAAAASVLVQAALREYCDG